WYDCVLRQLSRRPGAVGEPQTRQGLPTPSDPKSSARGRGRASGQRWGGAGGHRARDWRRREPPAEVAAERAAAPDDAPAHGSPAAGGSEESTRSWAPSSRSRWRCLVRLRPEGDRRSWPRWWSRAERVEW